VLGFCFVIVIKVKCQKQIGIVEVIISRTLKNLGVIVWSDPYQK